MNVQHPLLQDINVRQAIRYGIDVPAILEGVYEGRWARACAMIAPGQVGYWADAPCYERDVDKAKEYLAAAGLDSLDLVFRTDQSTEAHAIAEIVQANLADVGINIEIENLDDSAMTEAHFGEEALDTAQLFTVQFITNPDPSWSTVWFLCEQVTVWNWMEWCNEDYDRLHYEALKEFDPDKRAEKYIEMQKLWDEAVHSVWIAYPTYYFAYQTDIEPSLMPHGRILAWNFHSK
jgi:peptide/nickel transport system substrate-binding protein